MSRKQEDFERAALPHLRSLLRFARRLAGGNAQAEDLVQETCLRAWRGFSGFEPGTNMRAWLFRILINTYKSQARRPVVVPPSSDQTPGASRQQFAEVLDAMNRLPEEQRCVLALCVVEGFTAAEVAEILVIPAGTVMSRLSRGRAALRNLLAGKLEKVSG